jgi:TRAP-type C4-dicarboxylate transport system permease small subunit
VNRVGNTTPLDRAMNWLRIVEQLMAAGLLATILGSMGAQVVARYLFHSPISWSEEWARFALIWLAFLSAAFVAAEGRHIAVDMVSAWLSARSKLVLECVSNGLIVGTCLLLLGGGLRFVWYVGLVRSPALGIPMSCWYGAASTGLALMALHTTCHTLTALRRGRVSWEEPMDDELSGSVSQGGVL